MLEAYGVGTVSERSHTEQANRNFLPSAMKLAISNTKDRSAERYLGHPGWQYSKTVKVRKTFANLMKEYELCKLFKEKVAKGNKNPHSLSLELVTTGNVDNKSS